MPSRCPHSRNIAPDATGGGKHPPSSPKCVCVHVRMCEFTCWHDFSAAHHCCSCWCYSSKWGGALTRWAPLLTPENFVFKVKVLLTGHLWAYDFLMHYASVFEAILRYSLACEHICVCLWVNKNHCSVRLRNIPLPLFSPLRSQSLPARIDRPSADYWSMNLYKMIITICLFQ